MILYLIFNELGFAEIVDTSDPSETICYDELGCITTDLLWYDMVHRPINMVPLTRQIISTTFSLYTRQNKTEVQLEFTLNIWNCLRN